MASPQGIQWDDDQQSQPPVRAAVPIDASHPGIVWDTQPPPPPTTAADDGSWNVHDFLTGKGGLIREGAAQIGQGVKQIVNPAPGTSRWSGGTDVLHGAESMATPVMIGAGLPALALAPLPTAAGIAGATAGGIVGSEASRRLAGLFGASPEQQEFWGAAGGAGGAALGGNLGAKFVSNGTSLEVPREVAKTIRPGVNEPDFPAVAPEAFEDLKRYGGVPPQGRVGAASKAVGKLTGGGGWDRPDVGVDEIRDVIDPDGHVKRPGLASVAIANLQQQGLEPWIDDAENRGVLIPGDRLVSAVTNAIPDYVWQTDPDGSAAIVADATKAFGGRAFKPSQFRDWLRTTNATAADFYNKSQGKQNATATAGKPAAIVAATGDAIRDNLYNYIDPDNQGAGPRDIQQRTKQLIGLRDAANRMANRALAEKPSTFFGGIANTAKGLKILAGDPAAASAGLHPFNGPTDASIADIYRQVPPGRDLPLPKGWPQKQLTDANGPLPSGVADFRSVGSPYAPSPSRQLGPATSPAGVSGVIVPDLAGAAQRDAAAMANRPALPAASGSPIITPELSGYAKEAARRINKGPRQITPATRPTMGGTGTIVPGNTSISPRGVYGQAQLPPPPPGEPPLNLPQQPLSNVVTGPGAGGSAATQSTGSPSAPLPAPGEIGGGISDVIRQRRSQGADSIATRMGKAIISQQPTSAPSSGTLKYDPITQSFIPEQ